MTARRGLAAPAIAIALAACWDGPADQSHPNQCGEWDIEGPPLSCYPDSASVAKVSHNTFMIQRRSPYYPCTAWFVESRDPTGLLALTANHCIAEAANLADVTRYVFLYRATDDCNDLGEGGFFAQYPPETRIAGELSIERADAEVRYVAGADVDGMRKLDYTLLRFQGETARAIRDHLAAADDRVAIGLPIATCSPAGDDADARAHADPRADESAGDRVFVLGHPRGRAQNIAYLDSGPNGQWNEPTVYEPPLTASDVRVEANRGRVRSFPFRTGGGTQVQYDLDTESGNSGSPVWSDDHGAVIALHISGGGCGQNAGTATRAILDHVPANGINADADPRKSVREILAATTW